MKLLSSLLDYSAKNVPRYKGMVPQLEAFPVLGKQEILAEMAAHLSDELGSEKPVLTELLLIDRLPGDGKHDYLHASKIFIEETSGSSGIPFRTAKTVDERTQLAFGIWRARRRYDPLFTPERFYPFDHAPANMIFRGNSNDFSGESVDKLYTNLSLAGIRWVHGRAQTLCRHAQAISPHLANNKSICFAENTGYSLADEDREMISCKLKVSVIDQYGCREVWAIGIRNDGGPFTKLEENVVVEILDKAGTPISEPGIEGRIVVTSLHQRMFPIIRYALGDIGTWVGAERQNFRLAGFGQSNGLRFGGKVINGNEFSRSVLNSAHKTVGYEKIEYIQIRQKTPREFILAIGGSSKAQLLCEAINICWNVRFPEPVHFDLMELQGHALEMAKLEKPSLFTTKYMTKDCQPCDFADH